MRVHRHVMTVASMLALIVLAAPAPAQRIIAWDSAAATYDEIATVSPAFPMGGTSFVPWPSLGAVPPAFFPAGATAIDNTTGIQYSTDGFLFESSAYPFYPPLGPPAPGVFPWTFPMGMGPVTGMEMDPLAGILWVTDGFLCCGVTPIPGFPVVVPPFLVVGPVPVMAPPLTGLDWDPFSGSLWAVDSVGFLYNFLPGPVAVFLGPGPGPVPPFPGPPATGLALDKTAAGSGFYVSSPGIIADYVSGAVVPPGAAGAPDGLAYHALPVTLGGAGSCVGPGILPALTPTSPAYSGNPFFSYAITGFGPGTPLLLLVELPASTLLPFGFPFGPGSLFMDPFFSSSLIILSLPPMPPAGSLILPVPLGPAPAFPPGLVAYAQVLGLDCPAAPYFSLTDCTQFAVSLP